MLNKKHFYSKIEFLEYYRKPIKTEVKFGYGALHYRDFEFEKCFDENGILKLKIQASDDNLIYYYSSIEYQTARIAKLEKIVI